MLGLSFPTKQGGVEKGPGQITDPREKEEAGLIPDLRDTSILNPGPDFMIGLQTLPLTCPLCKAGKMNLPVGNRRDGSCYLSILGSSGRFINRSNLKRK